MAKQDKKKPRPPAAPGAGKSVSAVTAALHPTGTRPADAGHPGAKTGGKSASSTKGR